MKKKMNALYNTIYGGSIAITGTGLLSHAKNPTSLAGDIEGLTSIGVAGAVGQAAMGFATGQFLKKKKKKR